MRPPTFRDASDALCLTADQLVAEFQRAGREVSLSWVRQARMRDRKAKGYRPPPDGWEAVLLEVARKRGRELAALVRALEALAKELEANARRAH